MSGLFDIAIGAVIGWVLHDVTSSRKSSKVTEEDLASTTDADGVTTVFVLDTNEQILRYSSVEEADAEPGDVYVDYLLPDGSVEDGGIQHEEDIFIEAARWHNSRF